MASVCEIVNHDIPSAPKDKRLRVWVSAGKGWYLGSGCHLKVARVHDIERGPELRLYITGERCDIRTGLPAFTVMGLEQTLGLRIVPRAIHHVDGKPAGVFLEFQRPKNDSKQPREAATC